MQLRRLEIRDFRKLSHVVVDGLTDGLNVLVGDNEAGKSTLLAALRAVLFERHRVTGEVATAMLPHGQAVRPEISIVFDLKGVRWQLRKAFCQRPEAELIGPAVRLAGEAVEEKLADLFGFRPPGRGATKPDEHHGIYGLLWVEQGSAHKALSAVAARGSLAAALESEVGQVMGGERGRLLLAMAEARRDGFWDKRDKPRGEYKGLREEIATLDQHRGELEARLRRYDEQVATLNLKAEALARHVRENRLHVAVREVEVAREAFEKAERLATTLKALELAAERAGIDRETATERLTARQALVTKLEADRIRAGIAATEAKDGEAALARADGIGKAMAVRVKEARLARETAAERLDAIEQAIARLAARQAHERALAKWREAEAVAGKRRDAMAAAAALAVTKKDVAEIDRLRADFDGARIKRDAASVQIAFEPAAGGTVVVDGADHPAGRPLLLSSDAVLDLGGFGRLSIRPGGGVEALARAVDEAERRLGDRLKKLGYASRDAAAAALAQKLDAEGEAAAQKRIFDSMAPEGLEPLRLEVQTLAAASDPEEIVDPAAAPSEADRAEARRLRQDRQTAEKELEAEALRLSGEREAASRSAAVLGERAVAAARDHEAALRALASARTQISDEALATRLAEAKQGHAAAERSRAAAGEALAAADPDVAALELRRAEAAERAIRADIDTLTRDKRELEIELRAQGQEGLGEALTEAEGKLTLLRQQLAARDLEAQGSLLLHKTLMQAQTETKDRWLGPVRERVRPYLKLIQPDSEIMLNEKTFSIEHLMRGGVAEPFETLSVGAREQVAVITRLALADILRASGQPSAIILDDALVNTDADRLDRMHLVLQKAAESLQVLVLTCRERDFIGLGAPIKRL
jgi:energy-coupling factor transporter ATP-binding protein EcfA2